MKPIFNLHKILILLSFNTIFHFSGFAIGFGSPAAEKTSISFTRDIAPILAARCQGCHHDAKAAMGFNLSSFEKMMKGGKQSGPDEIIVAGKPDESRLLEVLLPDAQPRMPLKLKSLTESEIDLFRKWITEGGKYDGPTPTTPLISLAPPEKVLSNGSQKKNRTIAAKAVVAISSNEKRIAVSEGNEIHIYETNRNAGPSKTLKSIAGQINALCFSIDGNLLFVASSRPGIEGMISAWDLISGDRRFQTVVHRDQILSMKLSPDGKTIATVSYDKSIALTSTDMGKIGQRLIEHTEAVYDVAFDPSRNDRLASVSADRTLKIWDLKAAKRLETLSESTAELYSATYSTDGKRVYAAGVDRTIRAWNPNSQPVKLVGSALAHESAINHLSVTKNDQNLSELISFSEDMNIKRWKTDTLSPFGEQLKISDWVSSVSTAGGKVAFASFSGEVVLYDWGKTPKLIWQKKPGNLMAGSPESLKPQLFRFAALSAPSPRVVIAGQENEITLTALGIEKAHKIIIEPKDIQIIRSISGKANSITLKLKVPPRSQFEVARIKAITPFGITAEQPLGIIPNASTTLETNTPGIELNGNINKILQAIIEKPGQLAKFQFRPTNGNPLTIAILAKRIGSTISPLIKLKTESGKLIKEFRETDGLDPIISYSPTDKSPIVIEIGDQLYSGSTNHIAYIQILEKNLAETPLNSVVKAGNQTNIKWKSETGDFDTVTFQSNKPDLISIDQINSPAGWLKRSDQKLISSRIPLVNPTTTEAFTPPFSASLQFQSNQPANRIRMKARKGQPLVVETYARRLGRELDTLIDIKDASGKPVQLAAFRKVTDTLVAFRDHGSRQKGIRLTQWADFQMADYVLIGREITRIFQLPRNPDDDCQFFGDELRWGYFGTTPEQHSMSQTVTKLELLPPESENTIAQNLVHRVYYSNDDGGMAVGNDSYLLFKPPADGEYVVEVRETTSRSGDGANYALVVREPKPDFELLAISTDWNIAKGGSKLITVNIRRKDGFNEPVALKLTGLPEGWQSTEGFIEPDQTSCDILITPDHSNSKTYYDQMNWKLKATARISNQFISHELSAAGASTVITPESNLAMKASTYDLKIKPGSISRMILKVDRREPFAGRVPIDVKNLPYGVRVLDIGLNGVLITEPQQEREVRIYAEPWVKAQKRPFFAVGRAESAGTADSSPPVMLEVVEDVLATRQGSDR